MSNTYFKIKTISTDNDPCDLTLTAFVGGELKVQLTIQSRGFHGYIQLGDKEIDLLIAGLLERKLGKITATGDEQSIYSPDSED